MGKAKKQKYFVNQQDVLTIRCRSCGREGSFPVDSLRDKKHSVKVNCPCAETFDVELEFRQDYRKKTRIEGTVRALTTPKSRARRCTIADYSNGGLLLHVEQEAPIRKDDKLIVSYIPDNDSSMEVERVITVRHLNAGTRIGGAFVDDYAGYMAQAGSTLMH